MADPRATPTDAELNILRVLWKHGPSTVREVYEALYQGTEIGYTTALKLLQNMLAKGLVTRNDRRRQHVYKAAVSKQPTLNAVVRRWIDKTFAGSSAALAMHALDAKPPRGEELAKLRDLIQTLQRREAKP